MTRNYVSLQRRPFLTPIWLTALGAALAMGFLAFSVWIWATAGSTTVVVLRHAEPITDGGVNPALSAAGQARAILLSRMFGDSREIGGISAIYESPTVRSQMTAAPLAAHLGLTPVVYGGSDAKSLAHQALRDHRGARVLVVGRRETVPEIVAALSGVKHVPSIGEDEFGVIYIVSVPRIGRANVMRITY
jgi:phosphohistidine phosphatase SixA